MKIKQRGFGLIELLIFVVIIGLVIWAVVMLDGMYKRKSFQVVFGDLDKQIDGANLTQNQRFMLQPFVNKKMVDMSKEIGNLQDDENDLVFKLSEHKDIKYTKEDLDRLAELDAKISNAQDNFYKVRDAARSLDFKVCDSPADCLNK